MRCGVCACLLLFAFCSTVRIVSLSLVYLFLSLFGQCASRMLPSWKERLRSLSLSLSLSPTASGPDLLEDGEKCTLLALAHSRRLFFRCIHRQPFVKNARWPRFTFHSFLVRCGRCSLWCDFYVCARAHPITGEERLKATE